MSDENQPEIDAAFDELSRLSSEKKYEECLVMLDSMERTFGDPSLQYDLRTWRGFCLYHMDRYGEAILELVQARDLGRSDPDDLCYLQTLHYLARSYFCSSQWEPALQAFDEAEKYLHHYQDEESDLELCEFHHVKGEVLLFLNEPAAALRALKRAKKLLSKLGPAPSREADLALDFAEANSKSGRHSKAYRILMKIVYEDLWEERKAGYLLLKCFLCYTLKKYTELLEAAERAIALEQPKIMAEAYHYAGRAHYYLRQEPEAVQSFKKSNEYPDSKHWITESNRTFLEKLKGAGFE